MLTAMFSGNFPLIPEEDGSYFIDRDGEVFKYVLSYLRDGTVDSSAMRYREALLREANYFQLQGSELYSAACIPCINHYKPS